MFNNLSPYVFFCARWHSILLLSFCYICRWNFVVSQVPLWVAPNLITMVGLAVNIGTALILFFCCPTLTEPVSERPHESDLQ